MLCCPFRARVFSLHSIITQGVAVGLIYVAPSGRKTIFQPFLAIIPCFLICALKGQNLSAQSSALGLMTIPEYHSALKGQHTLAPWVILDFFLLRFFVSRQKNEGKFKLKNKEEMWNIHLN